MSGYDEIVTVGWVPLPDIAARWGVPVTRVRQQVRERHLIAVRAEPGTPLVVPAELIGDDGPVKGVPGVLTLLFDAGFDDDAALRWLFTEDPSLPGRPVDALRENRGTEVKRRAQAAGY